MIFSHFFPEVLKIFQAQIYFFAVCIMISFKFSKFYLLKGRQSRLLNSKRVKITKNVVDFLFRKCNLIFRSPTEKNYLLTQFSQMGLFYLKVVKQSFSKRLKVIYFFLEFYKFINSSPAVCWLSLCCSAWRI